MLDVSISYNRYKFLGDEFLTWLWYAIENEPEAIKNADNEVYVLEVGNRIVLENRLGEDSVESITIKGDDAGLEEGRLALRKGAVVTEINLVYRSGDEEWRFSLKGESLSFSGLRPPETQPIESKDDLEGAVLEKAFLYEKVLVLLDEIFNRFIRFRVHNQWQGEMVPRIRQWISA